MSTKGVAVQGLSSEYSRNVCMSSVLYPESILGRFPGMVSETIWTSSKDLLGHCDKVQFPVSANAVICTI